MERISLKILIDEINTSEVCSVASACPALLMESVLLISLEQFMNILSHRGAGKEGRGW